MNILVLTDFSAPSEAGVEFALMMMKDHSISATVFHCLTEEAYLDFHFDQENQFKILESSNLHAYQWLSKWSTHINDNGDKVRLLISGGELVKSVNTYCDNHDVDLIVMGSSGRHKSSGWGSNTQEVVKNVACPVLVVKDSPAKSTFEKVVFASAFTKKDKESFIRFKELIPLSDNAEIHLLCVDTESFFLQPTALVSQVMSDYEQLALPFSAKKHFYQDYNVKAGIRHFSESIDPDLIVMSNKARKPIKRLLMGNDAVSVAHHSEYPVLVINSTE